MVRATPRLYVDQPLGQGQSVALTREQAHYLFNVMRLPLGSDVRLFNGFDGEWQAAVAERGKKGGELRCEGQTLAQVNPPDLWLMMAPIKKPRMGFAVEKAVELGVARIAPILTEFTNAERLRSDKLRATVIEAAEQCEAVFVPEVAESAKLETVLTSWPEERQILFCDERLAGSAVAMGALPANKGVPWAIFIGPEGGFSDRERVQLCAMPQAHPIPLGPRILRAETAALAALTLWQSQLGDWR